MPLLMKKILTKLKDIDVKIIIGQEIKTNEFIDNKRVYKKRINFGTLPNSTSKTVAHEISNADKVIKVEAFGNNLNGVFGGITIPYAVGSRYIELQVTSTGIFISSNYDASDFTAVIDLYYTKK